MLGGICIPGIGICMGKGGCMKGCCCRPGKDGGKLDMGRDGMGSDVPGGELRLKAGLLLPNGGAPNGSWLKLKPGRAI